MQFSASTIRGAGRGKSLGTPTINLNLEDIPSELEEGIYACLTSGERGALRPCSGQAGSGERAVLHYGPRPVFNDFKSCEIHLLDTDIQEAPKKITIQIVQKLRDVKDFASQEDLIVQIKEDIAQARGILRSS
jgi:riboflavin kinase / FMN adenylyltransferase